MPRTIINLNDEVWVTLTETGEYLYKQHWAKFGVPALPLKKDDQGRVKMQLWSLATVFGDHLYNGNPRPPLKMEMELA
jgi:hypothetical protein